MEGEGRGAFSALLCSVLLKEGHGSFFVTVLGELLWVLLMLGGSVERAVGDW